MAGSSRYPILGPLLHEGKPAVGADLYVEDTPVNVQRLREGGHKTIVFTNSTNENLAGHRADTWEQVLQLVLDEKKSWERGGLRIRLPTLFHRANTFQNHHIFTKRQFPCFV